MICNGSEWLLAWQTRPSDMNLEVKEFAPSTALEISKLQIMPCMSVERT